MLFLRCQGQRRRRPIPKPCRTDNDPIRSHPENKEAPVATSKFSTTARKFSRRPALEGLEDRSVPAVLVQVLDLDADGSADDIRIRGDAGRNVVQIQDNGANTLTISIDTDGDGDFT